MLAITCMSVWIKEAAAQPEPSSTAQTPEAGAPENKAPEQSPKPEAKAPEKAPAEAPKTETGKAEKEKAPEAQAKVSLGAPQLPSAPSINGLAVMVTPSPEPFR